MTIGIYAKQKQLVASDDVPAAATVWEGVTFSNLNSIQARYFLSAWLGIIPLPT